jgi:hypothetical protein
VSAAREELFQRWFRDVGRFDDGLQATMRRAYLAGWDGAANRVYSAFETRALRLESGTHSEPVRNATRAALGAIENILRMELGR